jgi:hypothetical protein
MITITAENINELKKSLFDSQEDITVRKEALNEKMDELYELRAWKESAMQVESEWDLQEIANLLGVPLGESVRKGIYEKVKILINNPLFVYDPSALKPGKVMHVSDPTESCIKMKEGPDPLEIYIYIPERYKGKNIFLVYI